MRFDLYCRVIDNHGDLGVCWRLAADLAARGHAVRLVVDDAAALRWMAPRGAPGVDVHPWPHDVRSGPPPGSPPEVVVEAFGCTLPEGVLHAMAAAARPPVWINLEYLSAEPLVDRLHGLTSPQLAGPGRGLPKWFFYPGFTSATGGLIRETDLPVRQQALDPAGWRAEHGIVPEAGERCVSLFCYGGAPLAALLVALADAPTLLLVAPGEAAARLRTLLGPGGRRGPVRAVELPWLTQRDYDHLLASCDLNVVRGEDSFVRAQWAGRPMLWHIYPQHDGVHVQKLQAFLDRLLAGAPPRLAEAVAAAMHAFNRSGGRAGEASPIVLPPWRTPDSAWATLSRDWREALLRLPDLAKSLVEFARTRLAG